MKRIDYPDNTYKALTYNKDKDWVTSFRNRKGCMETYDYQISKEDPKNHFWSNVVKKCGNKVTNQSKYEFFHRRVPTARVFIFTGCAPRTTTTSPTSSITRCLENRSRFLRDGQKTEYTYYDNGYVRTKKEPGHLDGV